MDLFQWLCILKIVGPVEVTETSEVTTQATGTMVMRTTTMTVVPTVYCSYRMNLSLLL